MGTKVSWDIPLVSLLVSNFLVIFLALYYNWNFGVIFVSYWIQSVIILVSICVKAVLNKEMKTGSVIYFKKGRMINPDMSKTWNRFKAVLFIFIIAMFFMGAYFLYFAVHLGEPLDLFFQNYFYAILASFIIFFVNHLISLIFFLRHEKGTGKLVYKFALRVFTMHAFVILSVLVGNIFAEGFFSIFVFMIIKTCVDFYTHADEHGNI